MRSDPVERCFTGLCAAAGLNRTIARRLYRFLVVGVASSGTYVACMNLGVSALKLPPVASAVIAYVLGGVVSYVGNTLWGFGAKIGGRTAWRFVAVILTVLILNSLLVGALSRLHVHPFLISLVTAVFIAVMNFIGHSLFTYRTEAKTL